MAILNIVLTATIVAYWPVLLAKLGLR
jgi:hypothetical protein